MMTITKQTEEEQREMYSKMLKRDVIDMLIESNKHLNRILENTVPIYGVVKSLPKCKNYVNGQCDECDLNEHKECNG